MVSLASFLLRVLPNRQRRLFLEHNTAQHNIKIGKCPRLPLKHVGTRQPASSPAFAHLARVVCNQHVGHRALPQEHVPKRDALPPAHGQHACQVKKRAIEIEEEVLQVYAGVHVHLKSGLVVHRCCAGYSHCAQSAERCGEEGDGGLHHTRS